MCEIGGEKDVEDAQNADSGRRSWRALGGVADCDVGGDALETF
jgi:hypothetical protein